MVVFVIWYSLQRIVNPHRFLKYTQILRDPTTSEGCKNFSRGLRYTLWVSRRSAWIRAFERTYFHDHPLRRSKNVCEKLIFMEKKNTWATFLNLTFLIWYSHQRIVNRHRFLKYTQILRNLTTSDGCKNFSMGLGYTFWASRRSAYIRAFQRTNSRDHRTYRSKNFGEKLIFMEKNTVSYTFLNLTFLVCYEK